MADDGVKISALTEVLTEPATGEMVASVVGGVTYKRDIGKRLPSTMQKSALAGYGGTPSGTNPYATQTGATSIATALAKPLSDLSRVMRINGDGVPIFPDNVAGTLYKNIKSFTTLSPWDLSTGSATFANGIMTVTRVGAGNLDIYQNIAWSSKQARLYVKAPKSTIQVFAFDGTNYLYLALVTMDGTWKYIDVYNTQASSTRLMFRYTATSGSLSVDFGACYIGSGLYDTPVYDKACCNRATNYGALPVPAPRGLGLQFFGNGSKPLVFDNPVIGITGTIRFKFKTPAVFTDGYMLSNATESAGIQIYTRADGASWLNVRTAGGSLVAYVIGTQAASTEYAFSFHFTLTALYVYRNGVLAYTHTLTASVINGTANLYIGRDALYTPGEDFTLYDFEYVAEAETLDAHIRFMNGDDAVDSQQKANTGVPHAIAVNDSLGFLGSNGLRFPATQVPSSDANTLDDYEEGTFTPSITFGGASVGITYANRFGYYTKIGRMVQFSIRIQMSAVGSSTGVVSVNGLPFVAVGGANHNAVTLHSVGISYTGMMTGYVFNNNNYIYLYSTAETGSSTQLTQTSFIATSTIFIAGTYHV